MSAVRVAIVGAGLGGLYAAWRLAQHGMHDHVLLEARDRVGGRILCTDAAGHPAVQGSTAADRFDLGPAWFWPGVQCGLGELVDTLGLQRFEQFEDGQMVIERDPRAAPARMRGYRSEPPSMRLLGGMAALVEALQRQLGAARVLTGHAVHHLQVDAHGVELRVSGADGDVKTWRAAHVLLALPPRLVVDTLRFTPALPPDLVRQWRSTPTWMAPHAKYLAVYEAPFWRTEGLSGHARSACGPMAEVHDASTPGGRAALFGFLGVPARVRREIPAGLLKAHCREQLGRLFGPRARLPVADELQDWASDIRTATEADLHGGGEHPEAPECRAGEGAWRGRLTGIGSEWSTRFPGYLAGAIDAAEHGVTSWLASATSRETLP